jgi:hypothetical protein
MAGYVLQIEQPLVFEAFVGNWLDRVESCPLADHRAG